MASGQKKIPRKRKVVDKGGRPSDYQEAYNEQARKLCLLGYTDEQLADFFQVNVSTLNRWKKAKAGFRASINAGKDLADGNVIDSMYNRALGYSHKEEKIFQYEGVAIIVPTVKHYPPDPTSCIFWLKNRQRKLWADRPEDNGGENDIPIQRVQIEVISANS